jgi:hypothetical protein
MRRFTGLLTSLLLLHLTLVAADLTCAKHGVHGAAHAVQSDRSSHEGHHASAGSDATSRDDTSCEVPTVPACCQALASCGVSIAEQRLAESGDPSHLVVGVLYGADDTPPSWSIAPDTPPPKA